MKLLSNGWTTAESTFAGTTAGGGGVGSTGTYGAGSGFTIKKIVAQCGGSTVITNTSGMLHFRYGDSSNAVLSTMIILGGSPHALTSVTIPIPQTITLDDLNIKCNWFEFISQEGAAGGYLGFVFGE